MLKLRNPLWFALVMGRILRREVLPAEDPETVALDAVWTLVERVEELERQLARATRPKGKR